MVLIRSESPGDLLSIRELLVASFPTTAEADLVDRLRASQRLLVSLVAEAEDELVGHVAISPVTTGTGQQGAGLAPIAVRENQRGKGIGGQLVRAAIEVTRDAQIGWIVVLGEPTFYSRFGFVRAATHGLHDEYGGGDAFQSLELLPEALPVGAGTVRYAPEFAIFE